MKRLLAASSGDIYQICRVFRDGEAGRRHNPEFTLLEWYRTGFDHHRLMDEVAELLAGLLQPFRPLAAPERFSYRDAMLKHAGVDPFTDAADRIRARIHEAGVVPPDSLGDDRSAWLDLLLSICVAPQLGHGRAAFIYDFPPAQAALARIRPEAQPVAERFEVFVDGLELANGFHELTDAEEQRARFDSDLAARERVGSSAAPVDEHLLAALAAGLPDCAGVALGFDRVVMLATGASHIREVLSFAFENA